MIIILIILAILLVLFLLYVLSLMGRRNHPGLEKLRGWSYAHRGLHNDRRPENSLAAFRAALQGGYGVELDIHLLKDGNLAVIHDHSLKRTAGVDVSIEDLTTEDLSNYYLEDTFETIPTFRQILELFDGKAPLIIELKPTNGNYKELTEAAIAQLKDYSGPYCIESFDPRCIIYLKKNYPQIIRGQLTQNYFHGNAPIPFFIKLLMTLQLGNFLIMPDFVAYRNPDRKNFGMLIVQKIWGVQGVTWTLKTPEEHEDAISDGYLPIFEDFEP